MEVADAVFEGRAEECVLAAEVGVNRLLVRLCGRRDPVDPCTGDAVGAELGDRRFEQPASRLLRVPRHTINDTTN